MSLCHRITSNETRHVLHSCIVETNLSEFLHFLPKSGRYTRLPMFLSPLGTFPGSVALWPVKLLWSKAISKTFCSSSWSMLFKVINVIKKKHVAAIYLQNSVQMWMGYNQQVVNFSNQTVLLEKRLNFISGYAMRLVRAPSHCSSQLHSRIVGNLTKNYSSQPEQGPRWNPWNIRLLLLLLLIYWAQTRAGAGAWIACRPVLVAPAFPSALLLKLIFGHRPLHTHIDHCLTAIWATF